jgi:hypothetical protein
MPASRAQRTKTAERRAKAVAMRLSGADFDTIAAELGYADRAAAHKDITRAMEASVAEQRRSVEVYREETLRTLDLLMVEAWAVLRRDHITVSHGRVIRDDETGEKLLDDGPTLQAVDRVLKILDQRSKLRGENAPVKVEAITIDALDRAIADLTAELEGAPASEAPGAAPTQG